MVKITELTNEATPVEADLVAIVDDGTTTTKKATLGTVLAAYDAKTSTLTNKTFDADGTGNSITNIENADIKAGAAIDLSKLATDPLARANHTGTQAQSTITDLTTDLSSKAPLASPTFTGTVTTAAVDVAGNNIDNVQNIIHDISTTTTALDFSGDQVQTISISAATTFTTSNLAVGKSKTIKITTDGTLRTLTFPAWKFVGTKPDCVAAYAVEE
jgi:hypothetical protein